MRRIWTIVVGLGVLAAASLGVSAVAAGRGGQPSAAARQVGPAIAADPGAGERLLVALGGVFESRAEAEAANAGIGFGDLQGFYAVPVAQFQGFREQLGRVGTPGDFALVSVFRTDAGARAFVELAAQFDIEVTVLPERVRSLGGLYAGLGQEAAPDGTGPLLGPVPESLP